MSSNQEHWDSVYQKNGPDQVSWTQEHLRNFDLISKYANNSQSFIDIGGGDSPLAALLIKEGYSDITVLDISKFALDKAKDRLGADVKKVNWINASMLDIPSTKTYDVWHDRAAFHFLTSEDDIARYVQICNELVNELLIIASFSEQGPLKCSGLAISQYSSSKLQELFAEHFALIDAFTEDHETPFHTKQNFQYTVFTKKKIKD